MKENAIKVLAIGSILALVFVVLTTLPMNLVAEEYESPTEDWVVIYNSPANKGDSSRGIVVDSKGNTYVTGHSHSGTASFDFTTIKYDTDGNVLWMATYDGPENGDDRSVDIAIDSAGDVYVTGPSVQDILSFTYHPKTGPDQIRTKADNDFVTIKYNGATGAEKWVTVYSGPGYTKPKEDFGQWPDGSYKYPDGVPYYDDRAIGLDIDLSGKVYVTGNSYGTGGDYEYATVKYDTNGNQKWVARYDSQGDYSDYPNAITVDPSGNAYVTGRNYDSTTGYDYVTVKYDTNGNQKWIKRYNGPGNNIDWAFNLAVDLSGNVFVTGYSSGTGTSYDYATIKYDADGNQKWVVRYNGAGNKYDYAEAITLDTCGNIYVTGRSDGIGSKSDITTVKYDTDGNQKWVARYNGPGNSNDRSVAIALDLCGNVYVAGYSGGIGTRNDLTTIKLDPSGSELWVRRYNGPGNHNDMAYAIAIDLCGNVYVTGETRGSTTGTDWCTIKYAPSPIDATKHLICLVKSMNLQEGIEDSLVSKLENALKSIEKDNNIAAIYQLNAFNYEVSAQKGKALTDAQADILTRCANCIIVKLQ